MTQVTIPTVDTAQFPAVAASPGITVLDFTAAWCGPCRTIKPVLAALADEYKVRVVMIDCDADPILAQQYNVRSMPTVVLLRDGKEVGRVVGARPRAFFAGMLDRALAGDVAIAGP
jgi:thioredoxin 1